MTVASAPGTGTLALGSAVSGFQDFATAGVLNGDVVAYVIEDGTAWEIGTGTYGSTGTTLTRGTIQSSNADSSAITASASATVYITLLAQYSGFNGQLTQNGSAASVSNPIPVAQQGTIQTAVTNPVTLVGVKGSDGATLASNTNSVPVNVVGGAFTGQLTQGGTAASAANPLPTTSGANFYEVTASIASNATYNGTTRTTPGGGLLFVVHLFSSAYTGSWNIQQSPDGTNWTTVKSTTVNNTAANSVLICDAVAAYYRVQLVNSFQANTFTIFSGFTQQSADAIGQINIANSPTIYQGGGPGYTETSSPLAANAVYTGTSRTTGYSSGIAMLYSTFFAMIYSDQSCSARIEVQDSGGSFYPCSNNVLFTGYQLIQAPANGYNFRVVVTCGATQQAIFQVRTGFSRTGGLV